jgi:amidohydrolase
MKAPMSRDISQLVSAVQDQVKDWRRDFHCNPELGFMEHRTASIIAQHLSSLGLDEVRTGIATTGVVGILHGLANGSASAPKRVIALRADMDALPIEERTGLPFASSAKTLFDGQWRPVMHACGHDAHSAMLMGAASVLTKMRDQFAGTVVFLFQPNEEGVEGSPPGAQAMLDAGALADPKPDALFALHVEPGELGRIDVRSGAMLSSATKMAITLYGQQTHAARPWEGSDVVVAASELTQALVTLPGRRVNAFALPSVVSIGSLQAGIRGNVLPGEAKLLGTLRCFDALQRDTLKKYITTHVETTAQAHGLTFELELEDEAEVTYNDPALVKSLLPALERAAGTAGVRTDPPLRAAAEDFSLYRELCPSVYCVIGSTPNGLDPLTAPTNHSDLFDIDERVLPIGVRTHVEVCLSYLSAA